MNDGPIRDAHPAAVRAMTDDMRQVLERLGTMQMLITPRCPWQNGKVERFNRTLQTEWVDQQIVTSNADRANALGPWLESHNT